MRVLGIDPGTINMGYGVIDESGGRMTMVACGVFSSSARVPMGERLHKLYQELVRVIASSQPGEVAVEEPFVSENVRTALAIGRAQAIALLAAAGAGLPAFRYSPAQVKQRVTNYGGSDKAQVQAMVRMHLGLAEPPRPDDAADALAVAICHVKENHLNRILAAQQANLAEVRPNLKPLASRARKRRAP